MRIFGGILVIVVAFVVSAGLDDERSAPSDESSVTTGSVGTSPPMLAIIDSLPDPDFSDVDEADGEDGAGTDQAPDDDRCFSAETDAESSISGLTVVIDSGHGGEDLGTINTGFDITESELVLSISRFLRDHVNDSGAHACLTRIADYNLSLQDRADLANQWEGDVFVSVHLNHLPDPNEDYTMTMWGREAKDRLLAETMLPAVAEELAMPEAYDGYPNPMSPEIVRLEDLDSSMLRSAEMPAVLVEAAFLSNPWEARAFVDGIADGSRWRERQVADAVHRGLLAYFSEMN